MIQGVIHLLLNDSRVKSLVGSNDKGRYKVFATVALPEEANAKEPLIVGVITGTKPTEGRCVSTLDNVFFDLLVYAPDYETLDNLVNESRLTIDGFKGEVQGINFDNIRFANQVDDYDEHAKMYLRVVSFLAVVRRKLRT